MHGVTVTRDVSLIVNDDSILTKTWHLRLGHVSEWGLTELSKQNLLCGHKVGKLQFCENCVLGKSTRIKFTNAKHTTQSNLEYIHSDLWGPARTQIMGEPSIS